MTPPNPRRPPRVPPRMHVPEHYAATDPDAPLAFADAHGFALLVSTLDGRPVAMHLPLLRDGADLLGHMARDNPQWRGFAEAPVLAVFSGPHAYISPSWVNEPGVVPTWNYVAVHAAGHAAVLGLHDAADVLARVTQKYEAGRPNAWAFDPAEAVSRRLMPHLVAFRIRVETWEGKWKLSQNHPPRRRERVAAALEAEGGDDNAAVAALMRAALRG